MSLSEQETTIARPILKEVEDRLTFLKNVGLDYLTLSRAAGTLSGGEAQKNSLSNTNWIKLIRRSLHFR